MPVYQACKLDVVELAEASAIGIHEVHAGLTGSGSERLPLDPTPHERAQVRKRYRLLVEPFVRIAQRRQDLDNGAAGAKLTLPQGIVRTRKDLVSPEKNKETAELL